MKNITRKEEIACNKQFLLFSPCFPHYMALIFHFKGTLKCCLQFVSIRTSLKFCRLVMGIMVANQILCTGNLAKIKLFISELTLSQTTNFRLFQTEGVCRQQF